MAMKYKNYPDFLKSALHAVPMEVAQPQMVLGTVLEKKGFPTPKFQRIGNLGSLCAATEGQQQIRSDLAKWEDLDHPFGEKKSHDSFQGFCRSNASGFLGVVVFNTAEVQAWMKEYKFVKFQVSGITCQYLKDDYLVDIITSGKWQPSRESLRDFYIIHEIVLATEIKFHVGSGASAGAGAQINVDPLPVPVGAHLKCSKGADDGFTICGVTEDGVQPKPFPIAFRTAHIKYRKQKGAFKPPRLELGRRRGDDDGGPHVSAFVRKDEKFHIGDFFLNMDDEDDDVEPSVVPIDFDENN